MTNDFVLKTMDFATADVDLKDFTYGMLMGMFERLIEKEDINVKKLNDMKKARI